MRKISRNHIEKLGQQAGESGHAIQAKLPKPEITKLNGMHIDWFRLQNQCKAEINRQAKHRSYYEVKLLEGIP